MIEGITATTVTIITLILYNAIRLIKYNKRRVNWFRPEFDGKFFDIVTSSRIKNKPNNVPEKYRKEDETVIGDLDPAFTALAGRPIRSKHYLPEKFKSRMHKNVMAFGGGVGNDATEAYLDRLNCPLRFDDYKIIDIQDNKEYEPEWDNLGRIRKNYSLIIRTPNPFNPTNTILYIFAGIHRPGTMGAALFTQSRFAEMINEPVKGMKAFVVLAEIDVDYLGVDKEDPMITPKSIIRVYDLPYIYFAANY